MEDIYSLILEDKLSWEYLIIDVVKEEGIDPWNIDISRLSKGYLERVKKMKELNFRLSGKILLIASILLRLKSRELSFSKKSGEEEDEEERTPLLESIEVEYDKLDMNVPLPKKRKVTLQELMSALEGALVVKTRKEFKRERFREMKKREEFMLRVKEINIGDKINSLFARLKGLSIKNIFFSKLIPSQSREDIVWTFLPLLHLSNANKVRLSQEKVFGEINVELVEDEEQQKKIP